MFSQFQKEFITVLHVINLFSQRLYMRLVSNVLERWSLHISPLLHFVLALKWRVLLVLLGLQAWRLDIFLLCCSSYIGLMEASKR